jgi:hypothetical protein
MIFAFRLKGAMSSPERACLTPVMLKHTGQEVMVRGYLLHDRGCIPGTRVCNSSWSEMKLDRI